MFRCDVCKHRQDCICGPYGCECFETDIEEHDKQIRAEIIDELTQKVEFEEKWLFACYRENGCKYSSKDIDIAFDGIKHCLRKLKGE